MEGHAPTTRLGTEQLTRSVAMERPLPAAGTGPVSTSHASAVLKAISEPVSSPAAVPLRLPEMGCGKDHAGGSNSPNCPDCEKPLHVRVAEALGWVNCHLDGEQPDAPKTGRWFGKCQDASVLPQWAAPIKDSWIEISRYDADWAATGRLIEKYAICVMRHGGGLESWRAEVSPYWEGEIKSAFGSSALIAVCNLILALKEAGKL